MTIRLSRLAPDPDAPFPAADSALREPNGLLAYGGDLHPQRLMNAYRRGIFPWYAAGEPILWWSPDPRVVFETGSFELPRRFRRELRRSEWTLRCDTQFAEVVAACAGARRAGQDSTWITSQMQSAYQDLHQMGHAHSVEVFEADRLVGGIYGVATATLFCGESMFSAHSGGSKVALAALCRLLHRSGVAWLDAQVPNPHLQRLGAREVSRREYLDRLGPVPPGSVRPAPWHAGHLPRLARELA